MGISTSPIPSTPAELDAIKRRLQDPTIDVPKLQQYATGSEPSIPGYIALGEISRRSRLVQNQQAQGANDNTPTVLQQTAQMAQKPPAPPQGIAQGMPPGAPPPQGGQMPPQAPPQPPQMPQQPPQPPVAAAGGGLMHLPMRPDMFRRSDYAHGGVVHFNGTEESQVSEPKTAFKEDLNSFENRLYNFKKENPTISSILEGLTLGPAGAAAAAVRAAAKPVYKYFTQPPSKLSREEQQGIDTGSGQKITTQTTEDPNAGMRILPSAPSGGGGGGAPAVDRDVRRTLDNIYKYTEQALPTVPTIESLEAERKTRKLDRLPTTDTAQLQEVLQSYKKPRTWDENLQLMAEDAANARPGRGFGNMALGRSGRVLDAANREKSIAISLKLEEIKNLDTKAQFAFDNGNFEAYKKYIDEKEKIVREVQKDQATVSSHSLTGIAQNQRASNAGASGLGSLKGTSGLSEQTLAKIDDAVADFIQSPSLNSKFWDYVPNAEAIKKKLDAGKNNPKDDNYKSAIADLQRFRADIRKGYENRLRSGEAEVIKKQVK